MRLLPATRRGIWLTALGVWLAGCAGAWWLLPVRPRCVIPGAFNFNFIGDGSLVLATAMQSYEGPFSVWDLKSGRQTRLLLDGQWKMARYPFWHPAYYPGTTTVSAVADRILIYRESEFCALNLSTGELLPLGPSFMNKNPDGVFVWYSRDHRFAVTEDSAQTAVPYSAELCDLESGRIIRTMSGPIGRLSPDGRRYIRIELTGDREWLDAVSYDTATGDEVRRFRVAKPGAGSTNIVGISLDNRYLALQLNWSGFTYHPIHVFDVSNGERAFDPPNGAARREFAPDRGDFLETIVDDNYLQAVRCWHLTKGRVRWATDIGHVDNLWTPARIQVDRSAVSATTDRYPQPKPIDQWLKKILGVSVRAGIFSEVCRLDRQTGEVIDRFELPGRAVVSTDGESAITMDDDDWLLVWDVPPRKPLTWLAGFAAAWGLLLVWLARRRVGRMATGGRG